MLYTHDLRPNPHRIQVLFGPAGGRCPRCWSVSVCSFMQVDSYGFWSLGFTASYKWQAMITYQISVPLKPQTNAICINSRKNDLTNVWGNKCDRNIDCDAVVFILVHVIFGWNFSDSLISKFWAIVFYYTLPCLTFQPLQLKWTETEVKWNNPNPNRDPNSNQTESFFL